MTDIVDQDSWEAGIYQYETSDPVEGGPDGIDNKPIKQLANRTKYLFNRIAEIFNVAKAYSLAGGTANAITASYAPVVAARVDGMVLRFKAASANTGATTFTPNATDAPTIAASPIYGLDHTPLTGGELAVNGLCAVQWNTALNSGNGAWVLIENSAGIRKGVTPTQFDNSLKLATTAFLKASGRISAAATTVTASTALQASDMGSDINVSTLSSTTQTLPPHSSCPNGSMIRIANYNTGVVTIAVAAGDGINANNGGSAVTTLTLQRGDDAILMSNSANVWILAGGSLLTFNSARLASSLSNSGYQKLPSGLIVQWGVFSVAANVQSATVTYPLAFSTGAFSIVASRSIAGNPTASDLCSTAGVSVSQFQLYKAGAVASVCSYVWVAVGV